MTSAWTDDRVDRLRTLWTEGKSASEIARALGGVTRNAVIGKAHRLGLAGRSLVARRTPSPRRRRTSAKRPASRRLSPRRPLPSAAVVDAPPFGTISLTGVGPHACRWPYGDPLSDGFVLCGRAVTRGAYCEAHAQLAYRATPPADHLLKLAGL